MAPLPTMDYFDDLDSLLIQKFNVTDDEGTYTLHDEEGNTPEINTPLTVTYSTLFTFGILSNLIACMIIFKNRYMHSSTNYFLIYLAVYDSILLLCRLPFKIYEMVSATYPLSEYACIQTRLGAETSSNGIALTVTWLTIERYISIRKPYKCVTENSWNAVKIMIIIGVTSLVTAMPIAVNYGTVTFVENGRIVTSCTLKSFDVHEMFVISSICFFITPMAIIFALNVEICIKLRSTPIFNADNNSSIVSFDRSRQEEYVFKITQRKITHMSLAVAVSFLILWAPYYLQRLFGIYEIKIEQSDTYYVAYTLLSHASDILYNLSAAINPVFYIMSQNFRLAFKRTLAACCEERPPRSRQHNALLALGREPIDIRAEARARARRLHGFHDIPPLPQHIIQRNIPAVFESPSSSRGYRSRGCRCIYNEPFDLAESRTTNSNSAMNEVNLEQTPIELATYVYNARFHNEGLNRVTYDYEYV